LQDRGWALKGMPLQILKPKIGFKAIAVAAAINLDGEVIALKTALTSIGE